MKSWKVAALTALTAAGTAFAYSPYSPAYTSTDFQAIVVDIMGSAGVFIYDNVTLIGVLLLLGFVAGVVGALFAKAKGIL